MRLKYFIIGFFSMVSGATLFIVVGYRFMIKRNSRLDKRRKLGL